MSTAKNKTFFELRYPFVVDSIASVSPNKDADLEFGDILVGFNGEQLKYFDEAGARLKPLANQTIDVEVLKNDGSRTTIKLDVDNEGKLGIYPTGTLNDIERVGYYDIIRKEYSFGESWVVGLDKFKDQIADYGIQLKKIFTPSTGAIKGLGGFKAIYDIFPDQWSWEVFWNLTAFLSIMLGVLNLLPIPALDGGHVMFLLYEMISGRKPGDKFMEYAQIVGFFILIALVLFANGNDIFKAIFN